MTRISVTPLLDLHRICIILVAFRLSRNLLDNDDATDLARRRGSLSRDPPSRRARWRDKRRKKNYRFYRIVAFLPRKFAEGRGGLQRSGGCALAARNIRGPKLDRNDAAEVQQQSGRLSGQKRTVEASENGMPRRARKHDPYRTRAAHAHLLAGFLDGPTSAVAVGSARTTGFLNEANNDAYTPLLFPPVSLSPLLSHLVSFLLFFIIASRQYSGDQAPKGWPLSPLAASIPRRYFTSVALHLAAKILLNSILARTFGQLFTQRSPASRARPRDSLQSLRRFRPSFCRTKSWA